MKKKVNGKIVDIKNINVFEQAAEGLAINRSTSSTTADTIQADLYDIKEYVLLYNAIYQSLPYPLYALDNNIKYATLATFIKRKTTKSPKMWINGGLFICIDEENNIAVNFVNRTWAVVRVPKQLEDNTNMQLYKDDCGFADLMWALSRVLKKETTSAYYSSFMKEFVDACNGQPMVLKWELGNILDFGRIPSRQIFEANKIVDLESHKAYILDIFVAGTKETKDKQYSFSLLSEDEPELKPKVIKQYGFDVYEKKNSENGQVKPNDDKIKKCELYGMTSVFNTLCFIKSMTEQQSFDEYRGFITDNILVYVVRGRLYVAKASNFVEPKEIARGIELYAFDDGLIYFVKPQTIAKGIRKETIYSYSLKDNNLRLCKIQFMSV